MLQKLCNGMNIVHTFVITKWRCYTKATPSTQQVVYMNLPVYTINKMMLPGSRAHTHKNVKQFPLGKCTTVLRELVWLCVCVIYARACVCADDDTDARSRFADLMGMGHYRYRATHSDHRFNRLGRDIWRSFVARSIKKNIEGKSKTSKVADTISRRCLSSWVNETMHWTSIARNVRRQYHHRT